MRPIEIDTETTSFLKSQRNLVLGTTRRDGSPQASPVWYLWTGSAFVISTISATAKWWNLKRDPRASICVDDPESGRMVVAYGVAMLEEDDIWDRTRELVARYYPDQPEQVAPHMERIFEGQKRVLITVEPDNIITRRPN
ncbi:MAG TPA: TIGR03618 family F420-dependent PPOX class oxidoreductase [Dehalococcoidia bacterium]|nr:TIGR03618 family F420-dependent PPOX class oxidoreductase [Dehalococcoidia bacterium]HJM54458.1 TIGR03618 family F420-dependent PPOX class oxidoreductase [Dehalococcoidia bacterium]